MVSHDRADPDERPELSTEPIADDRVQLHLLELGGRQWPGLQQD